MNPTVARMLLDQMDVSDCDVTFYRGQRITRRYLRHILWKAYSNDDHRRAMVQASRVLPMPVTFK